MWLILRNRVIGYVVLLKIVAYKSFRIIFPLIGQLNVRLTR